MERSLVGRQRGGVCQQNRVGGAARLGALPIAVGVLALALVGCGGTTGSVTPSAPTVVELAAGNAHSLALDGTGDVWAWGSDGNGQLGDGTTASSESTPTRVGGLAHVTAIAAGDNGRGATTRRAGSATAPSSSVTDPCRS